MRRFYNSLVIVIVLCLMVFVAQSQVMITPQVPPTGLVQKDQLWNLVLVSNSTNAVQVQLLVTMTDIKTGQKLLTGASRLLTIIKGARQLQINDVNPVQYNYGNAGLVGDRSGNGLLPVGSYQVCYTVVEQLEKSSLPSQEQCVPVDVQPLSPPQLSAPFNSDTIGTLYPLLQWVPPAPLAMFSDLSYEIRLVEINKGQQPQDALQKNTPIYYQQSIRNMFLSYPSSGKPLQEGKTYGWQVIARNGESYAEKTESWAFTVRKDSMSAILDYEAYPGLSQGSNAQTYVCQGKVRCSYKNELNDSSLTVRFYSTSAKDAPPVFQNTIALVPGQNYVDLDIKVNRVFRRGERYLLEAINSAGERWTLGFKYLPVD